MSQSSLHRGRSSATRGRGVRDWSHRGLNPLFIEAGLRPSTGPPTRSRWRGLNPLFIEAGLRPAIERVILAAEEWSQSSLHRGRSSASGGFARVPCSQICLNPLFIEAGLRPPCWQRSWATFRPSQSSLHRGRSSASLLPHSGPQSLWRLNPLFIEAGLRP